MVNTDSLTQMQSHAAQMATIAEMFSADPSRPDWLTVDACGIRADFSRQRIDRQLWNGLLEELAGLDVASKFAQMYAGHIMNITEERAVLHVASRGTGDAQTERELAQSQLRRALALAEEIRSDDTIDAVINIGIGGSDLGPQMLVTALRKFCDGPIVRFVSNIDPADLDMAIEGLDPHRTVIVVSSKTFTTLETMHNAERARAWLVDAGVRWQDRFVAATAHRDAALAWGIAPHRCLEFYDWVGGRFSVSSVIGFPVMVAVGEKAFQEFLHGMAEMDNHVAQTPLTKNLPVLHGALWFMNAVIHQLPTVAVVPYSHDLRCLPAFLQQLVMESNGKGVDINGEHVSHATSPVVWGEAGTNGQHAFFQMLHQGTQVVPVEFLSSVTPMGQDARAHDLLIANMFAQSEALAVGRKGVSPHREFPGNRPSSVLMVDVLSPERLGSLVAMYEHSVAVQGWLMGVNSFDQFGVELGKELALDAANSIARGAAHTSETLTHPLMNWFLEKKLR
jgi:glucose-6-phosphate isomerase